MQTGGVLNGDPEGRDDDVRRRRDEHTLGPDEQTLDGTEPRPASDVVYDADGTLVDGAGASEQPTGEIDLAREEQTVHEGAAPSMPAPSRGEDEDTLDGSSETDTMEVDVSSTARPGRTLDEDEETMDGSSAGQPPGSGIDPRRVEGTVAGEFAGTKVGGRDSRGTLSDDDETMFEAGLTESLRDSDSNATAADAVAGTRRRGHVRRIDTRSPDGASATARDAAAAGYTAKGGRGAGSAAPLLLEEGGQLTNRYRLVSRLGKGGMGEVWRARHMLLDGDFAIKVIKSSISKDKSFRARFLTEGQTMMSVKHPGVVEVSDLDQTQNNELFMVMQYLEGRTLYDAIRDKAQPLCEDVRGVARIFKELAEGMQRIHDVRIVHKDLKSDNALLVKGEDGLEHPKVIDFGLAKRLDDADADVRKGAGDVDGAYDPDLRTTLSGTLAYMAPEQFLGKPSSFQSDIYALGVMLFECFNRGEYPLPRGGLSHYLQLHADGATPALLQNKRPDLPREIAALADRCMAPKKADRPESFAEVAAALRWWLDAPERRRRRNRVLGMAAVVVFLVGLAITGFLITEKTASLSSFQAAAGGRIVEPVDSVVHLSERGLAALALSAEIVGEPKEPRLEVDGSRVDAEIRVDLGRLVAVADLSALEDGEHDVAFLASADAAPARMRLAIDRSAPGVSSIEVPGARDGFVASQAPEIRIALDETTIDSVVARMSDGRNVKGQPAEGEGGRRDVWIIGATAKGDGEWGMQIDVRDLAGNVTTEGFSYVRDTELATPVVTDLNKIVDGTWQLSVRDGVGANLRVTLGEPGRVTLRARGAAPSERDAASAGMQEFDLPPVSSDGYTATLVVEDRAGNSMPFEMTVKQVADIARIAAADGGPGPLSVQGGNDVRLSFRRSYAIAPVESLLAVRTRDATGAEIKEAPRALSVGFENSTAFQSEIVVPLGQLSEGTWMLSPSGQGDARTQSFELTLDKTDPTVHDIVIRDGNGVVVPAGGWSLTREVVVEVDAEDLNLASIHIEGFDGPTPRPAAGRQTYRFTGTLDRDGPTGVSVTLADAAGRLADRAFTIRADATDPVLTLTAPRNNDRFNDQNPAEFTGSVSEAPYTLHVAGELVAGGVATSAQRATEFSDGFRLNVGDGSVRVWVTDESGRRSQERVVQLSVLRLELELEATIDWTGGVAATMEKVEAGDVVIGSRSFPVTLSFVDRHEVTNAQYRAFLAAVAKSGDNAWRHDEQPAGWDHTPAAETWNDPDWSADDLPVVNVSFWDAFAFAAWTGRRLPTEAEWVKAAAKKAGEPDLLRWPTGNDWQDGALVTQEYVSGLPFQGPASALVGADKSPIGCLHMGGNVSEWVQLQRVEVGEDETAVRGGNWFLSRIAADVRTVPAKRYDRSRRAATIGFRCAVDAERVRVAKGEAPTR